MWVFTTCHILDDLGKSGQGQTDLQNFQFAISRQLVKIYTCGWKLRDMMRLCIICHILDNLEKLGQGQIELQNFQFAISRLPLKIYACGWKVRYMIPLCISNHILDDLEKIGQAQIGHDILRLVIGNLERCHNELLETFWHYSLIVVYKY